MSIDFIREQIKTAENTADYYRQEAKKHDARVEQFKSILQRLEILAQYEAAAEVQEQLDAIVSNQKGVV